MNGQIILLGWGEHTSNGNCTGWEGAAGYFQGWQRYTYANGWANINGNTKYQYHSCMSVSDYVGGDFNVSHY